MSTHVRPGRPAAIARRERAVDRQALTELGEPSPNRTPCIGCGAARASRWYRADDAPDSTRTYRCRVCWPGPPPPPLPPRPVPAEDVPEQYRTLAAALDDAARRS